MRTATKKTLIYRNRHKRSFDHGACDTNDKSLSSSDPRGHYRRGLNSCQYHGSMVWFRTPTTALVSGISNTPQTDIGSYLKASIAVSMSVHLFISISL